MTPWVLATHVLAWTAFVVAIAAGGRTERLAGLILLADYLASALIFSQALPAGRVIAASTEAIAIVAILWQAFQRDRWWLLVAAASLVLSGLTGLIAVLTPDIDRYELLSAQVGQWMIVYLALAAGTGERWLAGEAAPGSRWPPRKRS